jgi:hypothetical protein
LNHLFYTDIFGGLKKFLRNIACRLRQMPKLLDEKMYQLAFTLGVQGTRYLLQRQNSGPCFPALASPEGHGTH